MKYGALIIENRDFDMAEIIDRHKKYLPDSWEIVHFKDEVIKSEKDYNTLLTSIDFWMSIPFDKVLIFQHDSGLLRNGIEEFAGWDYVGAPWIFQAHGGNGGLSWRSKKAMIESLMQLPWNPTLGNEDVYFSNVIKRLPQFRLAPRDVCEKFSVEAIYAEGTLGYHAIDRYLTTDQVHKIKTQYVY
jgi:hypothetical protein